MKKTIFAFICAFSLVLIDAVSIRAQTIWTDATGNWFTPGNWSPPGPPTAADNAQINNGGTAQIAAAGAVVHDLSLGFNAADSGSLSVSGGGTTLTAHSLFVGLLGSGTLNITGGAVVSDAFPFVSGVLSTATVDGAGSKWMNTNQLFVSATNGALHITNGGEVTGFDSFIGEASSDVDAITVDGAGSKLTITRIIVVAQGGTGTLTITNGGTVTDMAGFVGSNGVVPFANGTATVDGAGSTWTNSGNMDVGFSGNGNTGTLNITNGGKVSNVTGTIASVAGSIGTVTVDGTGSTWTNSSTLTVGNSGSGTLNITNGGTVSSVTGQISELTGSAGHVTVDGVGSSWSTSASLFVADGSDGDLTITNGGTVNTSIKGIIADSGGINGTATVDGAGSQWLITDELLVGNLGHGTLHIRNGGLVTDSVGRIGNNNSSSGIVTVDGAGSTWTNTTGIFVGGSGDGTIDITNGGKVTNGGLAFIGFESGTTGVATVDGTGSTWSNTGDLTVGNIGTGTLNIRNGGSVSNALGSVGDQATGIGTVNVDGTGSTWTNGGGLKVGNNGTGTMHITNGGSVSNTFGQIGSNMGSTGTVTVDGTGSTWTNAGTFIVGSAGTGSLTITHGGTVSGGISLIGSAPTGDGTVVVQDAGSTWTTTSLYVGGDTTGPMGTGLLRIQNGGVVNTGAATVWNSGTLEIGANPTLNDGSLTFDGGTLRTIANTTFGNDITLASGGMRVETAALLTPTIGNTSTLSGVLSGPGGLFKFGFGTIILTNTNTYTGITNVNAGSLIVNGSITSNVGVDGLLGGTGTIFGDVGNGGFVSPGSSPGSTAILHMSGNYTQQNVGTLRIELGGLTVGSEYDQLQVGMGASLDGTLQLLRINGFIPHGGDTFTILTTGTGTVSGMFSDVTGFTGLLQPNVIYETNDVLVEFVQNSFNVGGLSPNQLAVAHELNEVVGDPRAENLIDFLDFEPLGNLPHDYDLIAPEELASIYEIGFSQAVVQNMNLQHRMDDIRAGSNGFCGNGYQVQQTGGYSKSADGTVTLDKNQTPAFVPTPENRWGVFATGSGDFVKVGNDDNNAHGYDITTGNVMVGADYRVCDHFAIGIDGGYAGSTADLVDNGRVEVDGGKIGAYATVYGYKILGSVVHVDGAIGGGWNSYDTRRTGLQDETVRGSTNGSEFNALLAYGGDWHFGCLLIGTWSSIQYTNISIDKFTETGSLAPLQIQDQDEYSLRGTTGARVAYDFKCGHAIVRPEVRAAWQHESGDRAYPIDARFASGAGDVFTVHGPEIGRDSALLDAGFAIQWNNRISTYVYYDGVLGRSNYTNNAVSGGFRLSF